MSQPGLFRPYVSTVNGKPHPSPVVESTSLSHTPLPPLRYELSLPERCKQNVSALQLETVAYAGQSLLEVYSDGRRSGFFLGDGTGVGKGRSIAAIFVDQMARHIAEGQSPHQFRALWVSVNMELKDAAKADMLDVLRNSDFKLSYVDCVTGEDGGWAFCTYASLSRKSGKTMRDILRWISGATNAVVVFDEAHRAKNLDANRDNNIGTSSRGTLTAKAVMHLQRSLPDAAVVYASATAASEVHHMAYMTRLGQWGLPDSQFTTFKKFHDALRRAGIAAMELFSCQLKQQGKYVARTLSFDQLSFDVRGVEPTPAQLALYRQCTKIWVELIKHGASWTAHQRFFRQLLVAFKVPETIDTIRQFLDQDCSVIVGVQSTGEANSGGGAANGIPLHDIPSTLHAELQAQVTPLLNLSNDDRSCLIASIDALNLPSNTIDVLVNHFGRDNVAEITGRRARFEKTNDGTFVRVSRKKRKRGLSTLNLQEKERFQNGSATVCVLSEAGCTGISLHADKSLDGVAPRQRIHIFLELPWSCDMFLQQSGRAHRSNQHFAPKYILMASNVPGEQRFVASITAKLQSLGALTVGSRDASHIAAGSLNKYNVITPHGNRCVRKTMHELVEQVAFERSHAIACVCDLPDIDATHAKWLLRLRRHDVFRPKYVAIAAKCIDSIATHDDDDMVERCLTWSSSLDSYYAALRTSYCDVTGFYRQDSNACVFVCALNAERFTCIYMHGERREGEVLTVSANEISLWLDALQYVRIRDIRDAWQAWSPESLLHQVTRSYQLLSQKSVLPRSVGWSKESHVAFPARFKSAVSEMVRLPLAPNVLQEIFAYGSAWHGVNYQNIVCLFAGLRLSCQKLLKISVKTFLNKLLAIDIQTQRKLMRWFRSTMADEAKGDRRRITLDNVAEVERRYLRSDCGIEIVLVTVELPAKKRLSWDALMETVGARTFKVLVQKHSKKVMCAVQTVFDWQTYRCSSEKPQPLRSVEKFDEVGVEQAKAAWKHQHIALQQKDARRVRKTLTILVGPIMRCWVVANSVMNDIEILTAKTAANQFFSGILIPQSKIVSVIRNI